MRRLRGAEEQEGRGAGRYGGRGAGEVEREPIKNHKNLKVYQMAFDAAMKIFEVSKLLPHSRVNCKTRPELKLRANT